MAQFMQRIAFILLASAMNSTAAETGMPQFFVFPRGMEGIVHYVKERYHNRAMVIIENGYASLANENDNLLHDVKRIHYHHRTFLD